MHSILRSMSATLNREDSPSDDRYGGMQLCGAKRSGRSSSGPGRCRHLAGWGTDHVGFGKCRLHGGNTKTHRISAVRREVEQRMANYGEPIDVDPATALLSEVARTAGHVQWLGEQVRDRADVATHEGRVLTELYRREREHLVRVSKATLDAGIAEREVRIAEAQGRVLAEVVVAVLRDLNLSNAQTVIARRLVGQHLRAITAAPA